MGLVLDAAVAGFGVALMRLQLGTPWLDSGRLVRLSARSVPSPHHYFLCWKPGTLDRWECAAFVDWLQQALA
jgi:LysR family transcriptional regulator, glycine cleavage system transcriptional activator